MEKVGWKGSDKDVISCFLYLVSYIIWEGEFEQNIAKIRLNIKDNT